jgi:DNA-directed RNA polymerase specialized sigma24 family protein
MPRLTVETARLQPGRPVADADARRLASAIARGDDAAFAEFYGRYQQRLLRFALVLANGDETLAQDAVQAAFLTAAARCRHHWHG